MGISDERLAASWGLTGAEGTAAVRALRKKLKVMPVYKMVDTCAGEFESYTPYLYSCYDEEDEAAPTTKKKILILGSGPNRIGQGIEFDYCCCHAAFALREEDLETVMINCNPETVSTDFLGRGDRDDCAVRRADSTESFTAAKEGRGADHRDFARVDRSRGRPEAIREVD
jgi:carbamoyl-phosphate synthase large subunit